jgi:hypothetical protein
MISSADKPQNSKVSSALSVSSKEGKSVPLEDKLDIEALADEVYRLMLKELMIEQQRMGLYWHW